jgi:ketosteroid isomerase-like protein
LSKSLKIFLALLSIAPAIWAEENASMPALRAVVESERNFTHAAIERGIRESFLQFFSDDSVIFAPEPKNGKKFYTSYEDKGRKLMWQPIFATISSSGELGVTTGPWELKKSAADETAIAFGQFVSIWRKQADNSWKVIVDVGIDNPPPTESPAEVQLLPPAAVRDFHADLARRALEKAEKMFADALKMDAGRAIADSASEDIRIFRENSFPAVGKTAAKLMLNSDHGEMSREILGRGLSASGDLAYRYGSYSTGHGIVTERGYYLSIWKLDAKGDWKLLIDLQKKADAK